MNVQPRKAAPALITTASPAGAEVVKADEGAP